MTWRTCLAVAALFLIVAGAPASAGERSPAYPDALLPPPEDDPETVSPVLGASFVLVPAGSAVIGSADGDPARFENETARRVTIGRPFFLQTTEVTQGQWKRVMGGNPSFFRECGDSCPVENVSWHDVQEFIRRLNGMEGTDAYRLPTEAQWEYAARAGTATRYCTGDGEDDLSRAGWWGGNSEQRTHPAGEMAPNAWGLFDMHGNVWEWMQDWYERDPPAAATDPEGPATGSYRVIRGGSWSSSAGLCRSAFRVSGDPSGRTNSLGFRLVKKRGADSKPVPPHRSP